MPVDREGNILAQVVCEHCRTSTLEVAVAPDFRQLKPVEQISAMDTYFRTNGLAWTVVGEPGKRRCICPLCRTLIADAPAAGMAAMTLAPNAAGDQCPKCGSVDLKKKYCARCVAVVGEHLHVTCKTCGFIQATQVFKPLQKSDTPS